MPAAASIKAGIVLLAALAAMLGALPFALFVGCMTAVPVAGTLAAVVAALSVRKLELPAAEQPTAGEWLLGAWSLVFPASMISLVGFFIYAVLHGGTMAVEGLAGLAGWKLDLDASWIGFVGAVPFAALLAAAAGHGAVELLGKLYPRIAGTRSPFFALASQPGPARWVASALALGVAVALWWLDPRGLSFTLALTLALFYSSLPLSLLGRPEGAREAPRLSEAIGRLLQAAGYRTTPAPVTGNADVDPLLADVDYLARSDEHAYAVDVKVASKPGDAVEWSTASVLRTAARALQLALQPPGRPPAGSELHVEPLLVIVGGQAGDALRRFAAEEGVKLALIADARALSAAAAADEAERRQRALELLGIPPGGAAQRASGAD